jgi:NADH:ubiquinone oxidoreductase subunit C
MATNIKHIRADYFDVLFARYSVYFGFSHYLKLNLAKWLLKISINIVGLELEVSKNYLVPLMFFLQAHTICVYNALLDITAIDFLTPTNRRFRVMYQLCSLHYNTRLTVMVYTNETDLLPTITELFRSAGWFECEIWDLFGIFFKGNLNLRRILTDYGFRHFPLRKDFPLSGYSEVYYNLAKKRVGYYRISVVQEYRNYLFTSPWL